MGNIQSDQDGQVRNLETVIYELVDKKSWKKVEQIFCDNPTIALTPERKTGRLPLHTAVLIRAPLHVIKTLVTLNPLAVNVVDTSGESPVHYAITCKSGLEAVQCMSNSNNTCLEVCDAQGLLPLHKALEYKSPTQLTTFIIDTYPDGPFERTKDGKLALHYACENQASLEVIKLLLDLNGDATSEAHNGKLPMHYACENKGTLETIVALHTADTQSIATKGADAMYPLHLAVQHRLPVAAVEYLIEVFPDALLHRDRKGLHPIHYALERNAPDTLVRCILTHKPETAALRGKGSPGNYPLSTALDKHYSSEIVRRILEAYPHAASERNMLRFLPLQSAMKHKVQDIDLLISLLEAYPQAAAEVDDHGRVVLHYCASRNMDLRLVQCLLDAYPKGASVQDKNGQLALHLAVTRLDDIELIHKLLLYHKDGVLDVDRYGMVALNYAIENDANIDLTLALINANKRCSEHIISGNRTVLHQAVEFKRSSETVRAVVEAYPDASKVQESAQGRLPLHWAIERLLPLPTLISIDEANPTEGAFVSDHRGWRSIHYAIHYPTPTPLVQRILRANQNIAKVRDDVLHREYFALQREKPDFIEPVVADKTAFLLLHYAIMHDALPETVAEIMLYTMPFTTEGVFNAHHFDTWGYIMAHCGDRYWRSVDIVLTHYEHNQTVITQLAEFRDQKTLRCMDIATPRSLHEILRRMYYFSRYEMHKKLSIHVSKYSLVHSAVYHNTTFGASIDNNPTNHDTISGDNATVSATVVLKFTNQRSKFIREVIIRTKSEVKELNTDYIIEMMGYHNAQEDLKYGIEIALKGFAKYPFLLVFKQGDRDFGSICKHEHFAGSDDSDLSQIRTYCVQLTKCVQYLHEVGLVHGDMKPSNIIRESGVLKLSNLGAAAKYRDRELVSTELQQLAYAAPELAHLQRYTDTVSDVQLAQERNTELIDAAGGHFSNRDAQLMSKFPTAADDGSVHIHANDLHPIPGRPGQRILSDPSQDIWSLGAIFYLMLTGESLFLNNVSEDIDSDQIDLLTEWPEFVKQRRLDKVKNVSARCLLAQMLSRNPLQRPSASYCLQHPFLQGSTPTVRYVGAPAEYDVFICYRRASRTLCTAVDAPLIEEEPEEEEISVFVPEEVPADEETPSEEVLKKNETALSRMFGNISIADSDLQEESQSLDDTSLGAESQNMSTFGDNMSNKSKMNTPAPTVNKKIDTTTDDGKYSLLQQHCKNLGLNAAPTATCPLSQAEHPSNGSKVTHTREVLLTKSSAAVVILTRDTWKCLEDKCTALIKEINLSKSKSAKVGRRGVVAKSAVAPASDADFDDTIEKVEPPPADEKSEQEMLLDDFMYEIRLIVELLSIGLLEKGVYVYAVGNALPAGANIPAQKSTNQATADGTEEEDGEGRVLDSYFERYMGEMVGRYGGSHPPKSMPNIVLPDLEEKLTQFMRRSGYGVVSNQANLPLYDLFRFLVRFPTFHIIGPERESYRNAMDNLATLLCGAGRINKMNSDDTGGMPTSRPNTGAFNLLRNSRLGSPQVLSRTPSASLHRSNFAYNNLGSTNIGSIAAGITAGIHTGILSYGSTVSGSSFRRLASSSGRLRTPTSSSAHAPNMINIPMPAIDTHSDSDPRDSSVRYRPARSPVTGLRVRAYTPTKSPRHLGYADAAHSTTALSVQQQRGLTPQSAGRRPRTSSAGPVPMSPLQASALGTLQQWGSRSTNNLSYGSLPVRPWGDTEIGGRNSSDYGADMGAEMDFPPENEVAFYNNQDIVTVPYFTEIVGEDRVRTANAMTYMTTKLEESENTISNLEDELALLRQQMNAKDAELSKLRTVVRTNSLQPAISSKIKKVN